MGRIKKTVVGVFILLGLLAVAVVVYMIMRIRRKKSVKDEPEEYDIVAEEERRIMQKAVTDKTPLAVERTDMLFEDEDDSLMMCKMNAESQKYDQLTLWKKYKKIKAEDPEKFCSLDNGRIKVEFYHQSYEQIFKIKIINARGLKCNVPNKELTTRIKVLLITPLKTRHIPRRTAAIENSNNPDFNQKLDIKLTRKTARDSTVEISMWSIDDFYKESLLGGFQIELNKYDISQRNVVEEELQVEFEEHENPGFALVSLGYKKEEEKLVAIVMRGRMLKCSAHEESMLQETINPYFKVLLYCNRKKIKKEKTETKLDQINPVFNQVMEFILPQNSLGSTNLVFIVMHKDVRTDSKQNIGRIIIGANANGRCWQHWRRAIEGDGKMFADWHQLWQ